MYTEIGRAQADDWLLREGALESQLSYNEREALSRFLNKMIEDVDKLTVLFESRGADAAHTRAAHAHLQRTLDELKPVEQYEFCLQSPVSDGV